MLEVWRSLRQLAGVHSEILMGSELSISLSSHRRSLRQLRANRATTSSLPCAGSGHGKTTHRRSFTLDLVAYQVSGPSLLPTRLATKSRATVAAGFPCLRQGEREFDPRILLSIHEFTRNITAIFGQLLEKRLVFIAAES